MHYVDEVQRFPVTYCVALPLVGITLTTVSVAAAEGRR